VKKLPFIVVEVKRGALRLFIHPANATRGAACRYEAEAEAVANTVP
jgi:hypothetical protein